MKIRFQLFIILICLFVTSFRVSAQVAVQDSLALVDLYNSTNGTGWKYNRSWNSGQPVVNWYGIRVNAGRVKKILLDDNQLTGTLPSSIGNLSNIDTLQLYGNQLSDSLPSSMGNLTKLVYLDLGSNQLSGSIPTSFSNLSNLTMLLLDLNQFSGAIPTYFSNFSTMNDLDLHSNQFTGAIPSSFGSFPVIQYLGLAGNQLTGVIPSSLGNLTQIRYLDVSSNELTGNIPISLSSLPQIVWLNVADNQLSGVIPAAFDNFSNFSNLESFDLLNNDFTFDGMEGLVPADINFAAYSPQSTILSLSKHNNTLSVSAGGTLSNNTYTWYANGEYNPVATITGDSTFTPTYLASYSVAVTNSVATQLTLYSDSVDAGPYVACSSQDSLALVALYDSTNGPGWTFQTNWLAGPVSTWYGVSIVSGRVDQLLLYNNNLRGALPSSLGNLANITALAIDGNQLNGSIPSSLGGLTHLLGLDLSNDSLNGSVPSSFSTLVNLTSLYLSNNQLTGSIPAYFSDFSALTDLELNNNQFAGSIPSAFENLTQLQYLDISDNLLTGNIPSSFSTLAQLQYLDVSDNQLSGTIPSSLDSSISLQTFNLFGNDFNFSGLEGLAQAYSSFASYSTQANLVITKAANNELSVSAGGTLANNVYTWYNNNGLDTSIAGDSTFTPTLPESYWVSVTNSIATALILNSDTANVAVLFCPPGGINDSVTLSSNCIGYTLGNNTYFSSGDYIDTLHSVGGCDSVVRLHLTIPSLIITYDTVISSACGGPYYILGNNTYTTSGDYMDTLISISGCDSIVSLHYVVSPSKIDMVTTLADNGPGSLRAIIAAACYGDTIRFAPSLISGSSATITLTSGPITIGQDLVIKGLYNSSGDTLYLSGNSASAIFNFPVAIYEVLDSVVLINGNSSNDGGAINIAGDLVYNTDSLFISNSIIRNCKTTSTFYGGGGIYADASLAAITITNSSISNNSAIGSSGGGILTKSSVIINGSAINNNFATYSGGGIIASKDVILSNSTVNNNSIVLALNSFGSTGGGISANNITVDRSTISNNSGSYGGALNAYNDVAISNSTINNNVTFSDVIFANGNTTIANSTITNNSASNGNSVINTTVLQITNSTIVNNTGTSYSVTASSITVASSIIALNVGGNIFEFNANAPAAISNGYNLFGDSAIAGSVSSDQTGITAAQLRLESLQNNGGTTFTMLPGVGSIAIGNGNPADSTSDQRGYSIPKGKVRDVGAVCTTAVRVCPLSYWSGSVSSAWENPSNWSCGIVPDNNTDVIIGSGTVVVNSNVSVKSLTLSPTVNFTINSGFNLTVTH